MQRTTLGTLATAAFFGIFSASFASADPQLELQPTPLEIGWFKRPVDMTSYLASFSNVDVAFQDNRLLTDFSPN
jgi:hypothetical protein